MANNANTKLQVNFKLPNGDLINGYGDTQAELEANLSSLQDLSMLIATVSQSLTAAYALKPGAPASSITPSAPASAPSEASNTAAASAPDCRHGKMAYREGVGDRGPWKGYMCAAPKGSTDKCKNIYL
jgi:hypothetical protein